MSWIALVVISNLTFALGSLMSRLLMKDGEGDPVAFGFVSQLIVAILTFCVGIFTTQLNFLPLLDHIPFVIAMSLVYALFNLFVYNAYKYAEASIVTILLASRAIWTVVSAIVLLNEQLTFEIAIGTILIIAGVAVIFYRKNETGKKFEFSKGMYFAIAAAACLGTGFSIDAYLLRETDIAPQAYSIVSFGLPAFTLLAFRPASIKNVMLLSKLSRLRVMVMNGVFYAISVVTLYYAFTIGNNASQIGPLSQTSVLFSVIFAYFFLNEKDYLAQKLLGSILVIAGAIMLL